MKLVYGLIDYNDNWQLPIVKFFTANQVVMNSGALVMGAGNAKAARDALPNVDLKCGKTLKKCKKQVYVVEVTEGQFLGALATKKNWKLPSNIDFVVQGLKELNKLAKENPEVTYQVPYPAISNGGLTRAEIDPIVAQLPDNVHLYTTK